MINYILIVILLIILAYNTIYCENFDNKDDSDKKSEDSFDESKIEDEINDTITKIDDNLEKLKEFIDSKDELDAEIPSDDKDDKVKGLSKKELEIMRSIK